MTTGTKLQKPSAILIIIMDIGQSARPAYAYVPRARLFSRSPRGGCSRMKCDECRHDAVRSSAPCGVCLTFMCKHIQQESSDGDWYFQGATWPDDNWNKTAKSFSDPHHNYGHQSVCPPRLCICPPSEIIFVISSRGGAAAWNMMSADMMLFGPRHRVGCA